MFFNQRRNKQNKYVNLRWIKYVCPKEWEVQTFHLLDVRIEQDKDCTFNLTFLKNRGDNKEKSQLFQVVQRDKK